MPPQAPAPGHACRTTSIRVGSSIEPDTNSPYDWNAETADVWMERVDLVGLMQAIWCHAVRHVKKSDEYVKSEGKSMWLVCPRRKTTSCASTKGTSRTTLAVV